MNQLKDLYLEIFESIDFEKIRDHPNILIAANFWERERFDAARVCYKFMRAIDDLIDDHKSSRKTISQDERQQFVNDVNSWVMKIFDGNGSSPDQKELTDTIRRFRIPSWPLEAFSKSMIYDIFNDGFATLGTFIDYAGGASVAPASIFVHLAGLRKTDNGFKEPGFNVKESAGACAMFSYLVHIIRDFQKDQHNNLNYFADDLMAKNGLTREMLSDIARGSAIPSGFRNLIREYHGLADDYRVRTFKCINTIWPYLEPRYQLSLEVIFELYLMVFERIDLSNGSFTAAELNPTPEESKQRVYKTIMNSRTLTEIS